MAVTESSSPLADLHSVHLRIARTMEQLDGAFVRAHKLGMAGQLSLGELRAFVFSMEQVEAEVQKWAPLFSEAALRPQGPSLSMHLPTINTSDQAHTPTSPLSPNPSTPAGSAEGPFTTPLTGPLLVHGFPSENLDFTPVSVNTPRAFSHHPTPFPEHRSEDSEEEAMEDEDAPEGGPVPVSGGGLEGEASPMPPTPSMPSPPRCCFVLKNRDSNASSSSFTMTPSSASPRTPVSFQRGPLSAMGHNQVAENQRVGLASQGLLSKGEGKRGARAGDELEDQENQGPVGALGDFGLERQPALVEPTHNWAQASLQRARSMGGMHTGPAPSPFRTPGVTRLMRLSPGGPSPVSPVQNLSFDSPATFATWQKKTRPRAGQAPRDVSDGSPNLRTPEMDSPPATTELQAMAGPDFEATSPPIRGQSFGPSGKDRTFLDDRAMSDAERLGRVEQLLRGGVEDSDGEPANPFDFPERFAPVGDLGLTDHSPAKAPARPGEWVGRKTVDVAEVMRGDDVAACDWKDGVAALRDLHVSKSATLPHVIDPLEVDVRPDFEPLDGAAALLSKKGFETRGSGFLREEDFGLEGSPGWMDGRAALKAYGLDTPGGPKANPSRLGESSAKLEARSPLKSSPVGSPRATWQQTKSKTVGEWVNTSAVTTPGGVGSPGEETPGRLLPPWGVRTSDGKAHRRSRSHDLGGNGTPRSDLGFYSPRGPKKGEWAPRNAKDPALDEADVINDGKENINPNVGAAAPAPSGLDLSAFPPVFRTGEAAQQLLTVFQQFAPPEAPEGGTPTRRNGSLSLSELDGLLMGYGTERLSLLLDLLASRGALQPFVVGRQMRWERPP